MNTRIPVIAAVGAIACAAAVPAGAFPWDKKKETPEAPAKASEAQRRFHMKVQDKAAEKELLQMFESKRLRAEEIRVVARLVEEKRAEVSVFEKNLLERFQIRPAVRYQCDVKTRTVYELIPRPGATNRQDAAEGDVVGGFDKKLHSQLKDGDEMNQFMRLNSSKRLAGDEIRVFRAVIQEKQMELGRIDDTLQRKFSLSRDRNYEYDPQTMRVYEIIGQPRAGTLAP